MFDLGYGLPEHHAGADDLPDGTLLPETHPSRPGTPKEALCVASQVRPPKKYTEKKAITGEIILCSRPKGSDHINTTIRIMP